MDLDSLDAFGVSLPIAALVLVLGCVILSRVKRRLARRKRRPIRRVLSAAALGLAFLPLSVIYRPSQLEVAKAQIRQQEDVDEDQHADPGSPLNHLGRQLRRIRNGEKPGTLFFRCP